MASKDEEPKKSKAELKAEEDLMMAKASIKLALASFASGKKDLPPPELQNYWQNLDTQGWQDHLKIFTAELKKLKSIPVKKLLFDLDHYIKDCKRLVPTFRRSKEELLLMVAIGQVDPKDLQKNLTIIPTNRENLDRKIHKQIQEFAWEDDRDLERLNELTEKLDQPRVTKDEVEKIEAEIRAIEVDIENRKQKRDELAVKLVEWKARGTIDIARGDGNFRLDA